MAEALGPGGESLQSLLDELAWAPATAPASYVERWARATPAGDVDLPVVYVTLESAVKEAVMVDRNWFGAVDTIRSAPRQPLLEAEREDDLEAALNITMLLASSRLGSPNDGALARMASGAQLWLLAGAVAWALSDARHSPFSSWTALVVSGYWPIGPSRGRLVVAHTSGLTSETA